MMQGDCMKTAKKPIIMIAIICCLFFIGSVLYHWFYDIHSIKPGEKIAESISPLDTYTITAYLNNGGATTDYAVLCVLTDGNHSKNIYWNDHCTSADIVWIDDDTVEINGAHLENVDRDTYDYRREK